MYMNLMRALLVVCSVVLIPNIASAYYAAHMGRWTSRDPFGQIGRIGTEMMPASQSAAGFVDRDRFDPMADYYPGMNLYEYASSVPTVNTDPSGLIISATKCGNTWTHPNLGTACCGGKPYSTGSNCCNNGSIGKPGPPAWQDQGFPSSEACQQDCLWNSTDHCGAVTTAIDTGGAAGGAYVGGCIGTAICPGPGTGAGGVVGGIIGGVIGGGGAHAAQEASCAAKCDRQTCQ
jgi:hypothetical protein